MENIVSRPYNLDHNMACERCVFKTGLHSENCEWAKEHKILASFDDIDWLIKETNTEFLQS